MRGDRELCMAAVTQDWRALKYASQDAKTDETVVLAALRRYFHEYPNDKGKDGDIAIWNVDEIGRAHV